MKRTGDISPNDPQQDNSWFVVVIMVVICVVVWLLFIAYSGLSFQNFRFHG